MTEHQISTPSVAAANQAVPTIIMRAPAAPTAELSFAPSTPKQYVA